MYIRQPATDSLDLRYELKLVCDSHWLPQARSWIRLHPEGFAVAYPPRRVNSLYLDTPHLSSFEDNMSSIGARQKLRLRWYGETMTDFQPVLELKQKRNLLGRKKQSMLPCKLDMTGLWKDIMDEIRASAGLEWQAALQACTQPALLNHYRREYYVTPDGALRVTLDFDQAAFDQRLSLRPNLRARLPIADTVVIEIKSAQDQVERLQQVAARFPVLRSRNSKYASGVLTALG